MAAELSGILEHVDRIAELDLDDVEPTTHVVALENVLRDDVPRPSLAARAGARQRSRRADRLLPRPLAAGVSDAAELTRRRGARRDRRGRSAPRASTVRRHTRAAADELGAYLWRAGRQRRRPGFAGRRRARRRPGRGQGHLLRRGRADHRGLADPRGLRAALHGDRGRAPARRRRAGARQDQHGRVRDGLLERELRLRSRFATPGTPTASPAAPRAARPPPSPAASRPARSAPTPAARSASPPRSAGSSG